MKSTLTAKILRPEQLNARQPDKKELVGCASLIVRDKTRPEYRDSEMCEAVTIRVYTGRSSSSSVVYACVWLQGPHGSNLSASGRGSAGGYGYHKESAAIAEALRSAGIGLYGAPESSRRVSEPGFDPKHGFDFGGTGSSYYREVFEAVARAMGHKFKSRAAAWVTHGI